MTDQEKNDLLIRIDANVKNMAEGFRAHIDQDKLSFDDQDKRIKDLERVLWCGVGALGLLQLGLTFFK